MLIHRNLYDDIRPKQATVQPESCIPVIQDRGEKELWKSKSLTVFQKHIRKGRTVIKNAKIESRHILEREREVEIQGRNGERSQPFPRFDWTRRYPSDPENT